MSECKANCVSPEVCDARMNVHDERFRRDKERLEKHDANLEKLNEVSIQLNQMITLHTDGLQEHGKRLSALEHRPGKLMDKMTGALITALTGGLAAALLALLLE